MPTPTRDGKKSKTGKPNGAKEAKKETSNGRNGSRNRKRNENKQIRGKAAAKNITKPIQSAEDELAVENEEAVNAVPVQPPKLRLRVNVRPRFKSIKKIKPT